MSRDSTPEAVRLRNVDKRFGETVAVEGLDLTVPSGTIYGLLGPNGAGKTTTIRIIMDILGPDAGTVEVLGRRVDDAVRERIGYLPEERGLYQKMTALDQLEFLGVIKGLDRSEARSRAESWLERFDLADRADEKLDVYSKGMQQKVQFIGTIIHDPELIILDEPFSGLDPINVDLLKEIVLEKHREGTTILFSTHRIEDAERLCSHVCMIAGARKVLDGRVSDVKSAAGEREVALSIEGDASFLEGSELVGRVTDHGRYREVRLAAGADPQELLQLAVSAGAHVQRFELVEPPLRDIFLEKAGKKGLPTRDERSASGVGGAR
ncbi:MAG: ABC transporter ATP-binding protein [Gemmatimonadota bacterium]